MGKLQMTKEEITKLVETLKPEISNHDWIVKRWSIFVGDLELSPWDKDYGCCLRIYVDHMSYDSGWEDEEFFNGLKTIFKTHGVDSINLARDCIEGEWTEDADYLYHIYLPIDVK